MATTDGVNYDKASYTSGDTIIATVVLAGQTQVITGGYTAHDGTVITNTTKIVEPVGKFSDGTPRVWTLVAGSYDGVTAKFTATA